jgi:acetyltransferase
MMEQTRIFTALAGVRGRAPVDLAALEQFLVQFSQLVVEQPWIREIDINPVLVSGDRIVALDARVLLHDPETKEEDLPKLAIRPYPTQYVAPWKMKNGRSVVIRPIRPEDEPMMIRFHETLSERSVYLRYFHSMKLDQRVAHERLTRICFIDYDREMALVVERNDPDTGEREILGVGRLIKLPGGAEAEFAVVVSDRCQGCGIGSELLKRLIEIGRSERLQRIVGDILPDNDAMKRVCEKLGFSRRYVIQEKVVRAEIDIR